LINHKSKDSFRNIETIKHSFTKHQGKMKQTLSNNEENTNQNQHRNEIENRIKIDILLKENYEK